MITVIYTTGPPRNARFLQTSLKCISSFRWSGLNQDRWCSIIRTEDVSFSIVSSNSGRLSIWRWETLSWSSSRIFRRGTNWWLPLQCQVQKENLLNYIVWSLYKLLQYITCANFEIKNEVARLNIAMDRQKSHVNSFFNQAALQDCFSTKKRTIGI